MLSKDKRFTISNIITISRLVILPLVIYFLVKEERLVAFMILLILLISDGLDGYIARRFHQESELGKVLDPLCDKISFIVILITLLLKNCVPAWAVIFIIARDLLIIIGSFIIFKKEMQVFKSNSWGKFTGFLFGAMILAFTLKWQYLGMLLLYLALPVMLITFITYGQRYLLTINKGHRARPVDSV